MACLTSGLCRRVKRDLNFTDLTGDFTGTLTPLLSCLNLEYILSCCNSCDRGAFVSFQERSGRESRGSIRVMLCDTSEMSETSIGWLNKSFSWIDILFTWLIGVSVDKERISRVRLDNEIRHTFKGSNI
jgi:hypothetical protein